MTDARPRPWWRPTCGAAVGCLLLLAVFPGLCVWLSGESARRHARVRAQVRPGMPLREALMAGDAERMTRILLESAGARHPEHWVERSERLGWVWREPVPHNPPSADLDEVARVLEREVAAATSVTWSLVLHWPSPGWDSPGPDLRLPLEAGPDGVVRVR